VENHEGTYLSSQKNVTLAYFAASVMKKKSFKALKFVLWQRENLNEFKFVHLQTLEYYYEKYVACKRNFFTVDFCAGC
jgi:hypothetical protein